MSPIARYESPSAITGQTVVADVVLNHPMEPRALRMAIRQHLNGRLAPTRRRPGSVSGKYLRRPLQKRRRPIGRP